MTNNFFEFSIQTQKLSIRDSSFENIDCFDSCGKGIIYIYSEDTKPSPEFSYNIRIINNTFLNNSAIVGGALYFEM